MALPTVTNGSTPSKREISWGDFCDGGLPATLPRQRFTRLVHEATAAAQGTLPARHSRRDRVRDLVLADAVIPNEDDHTSAPAACPRRRFCIALDFWSGRVGDER